MALVPYAGSSSTVVTRCQTAIAELTLRIQQHKPSLKRFIVGSITSVDVVRFASYVLPEGALFDHTCRVSAKFYRMCRTICFDMGLDHKALPVAQCQPILSKMFADFPLSEHAMTTVWEQLVSLQPPKKKIKADKDGACAQLVPYMSCTNAQLVSKLSLRDIRVASLRASNKQHLDNLLKSRIKCEELQNQLATVTQERDSAFAELSFKGDHKKK